MLYDVTVFAVKSSIYLDASGHCLLIIWVNLLHQIAANLMNSWHNKLARSLGNRHRFPLKKLIVISGGNWLYSLFQYTSMWIEWHPLEKVRASNDFLSWPLCFDEWEANYISVLDFYFNLFISKSICDSAGIKFRRWNFWGFYYESYAECLNDSWRILVSYRIVWIIIFFCRRRVVFYSASSFGFTKE